MLAMSLVLFVALIYLHQASQVSVLQFNISELQAQQGNLNQVNAQLHATQSGLLAPARIEAAARTLNMTKPDPSTIVWVSVVQPKVAPLTTANADMTAAQSRSEPAAWVRAFVSTVRNSL
jgi:cell division protein FtsL